MLGAFSALQAFAQTTTTNQGTNFYLGFGENLGSQNLVLFITGSAATTGIVAVPGVGFSYAFSVAPGSITAVDLPVTVQQNTSDQVENLGIHVTSEKPVTVYGLNQVAYTTDAYLGLPAPLLGMKYIVLGYTGGLGGPSEFQVVGAQNGTTVTITPSTATANHAAGVPYKITLNQLQTYQLQASSNDTDLSGTIITSTGPIAVFGGSECTNIPNGNYIACDYVVEQIPTTDDWGKDFLIVPLATRLNGDTFRVIARDAGTTVTIDGVKVATLGAAKLYQTELSSTANHVITTSGPSLVAQYSNSTSYDNVLSDPMMMLISPTEQFLTSYTTTTPAATPETYTNYINVVAQTSDTGTCRIDGAPITTFTPIPGTMYSGAKVPVGIGTHNVTCSNPFQAYNYGFASYDSYGYPGGLGLKGIAAPRCDVNGDGKIDSLDINLILSARNTAATGPGDERDADGDLEITVADARVCQQRCTHAGCSVQ